jgi:hypothetical protein
MSQETSTSPMDVLKTLYALVFCRRFGPRGTLNRADQ